MFLNFAFCTNVSQFRRFKMQVRIRKVLSYKCQKQNNTNENILFLPGTPFMCSHYGSRNI